MAKVLIKALVLSSNPAWTYYVNGFDYKTFSYLILNLAKSVKNIVYLCTCSSFLRLNTPHLTYGFYPTCPPDLFPTTLFPSKVFTSSTSHSTSPDSHKAYPQTIQTFSWLYPQNSSPLPCSYVKSTCCHMYILAFFDDLYLQPIDLRL